MPIVDMYAPENYPTVYGPALQADRSLPGHKHRACPRKSRWHAQASVALSHGALDLRRKVGRAHRVHFHNHVTTVQALWRYRQIQGLIPAAPQRPKRGGI